MELIHQGDPTVATAARVCEADPLAGAITKFPNGVELRHFVGHGILVTPAGLSSLTGARYAMVRMLVQAGGEPVSGSRLSELFTAPVVMRTSVAALRRRGIPVVSARYVGYSLAGTTSVPAADSADAACPDTHVPPNPTNTSMDATSQTISAEV